MALLKASSPHPPRKQISELRTVDQELASDSRQRLVFAPEFRSGITVDAKSFAGLQVLE